MALRAQIDPAHKVSPEAMVKRSFRAKQNKGIGAAFYAGEKHRDPASSHSLSDGSREEPDGHAFRRQAEKPHRDRDQFQLAVARPAPLHPGGKDRGEMCPETWM